MGWFSSSKSYFGDSWDTSIEPTANGEDVYAVQFGSREFVGSVPNSSGVIRCRWSKTSGGNYIFVTCRNGEAYNIYENCVEKHSLSL